MRILQEIRFTVAELCREIKKVGDADLKDNDNSLDYRCAMRNDARKKISTGIARLDKLNMVLKEKAASTGIGNVSGIIKNLNDLKEAYSNYERKNSRTYNAIISNISENTGQMIPEEKEQKIETFEMGPVPEVIRKEIEADAKELNRCFQSGCYRAGIIICARMLEIALHRKYFEVTQNDILETNPGIGLGKLIAKLKENEVFFDPGLMDQIHMINKMRIHSVHRKNEIYDPSKEQALAMMLYTKDVIKRLF